MTFWPLSCIVPLVSGSRSNRAMAALAGVALSLLAGVASAEEMTDARLTSVMDGVFGRGAWRMTGGYRTQQRENELRAQGAKTVRPGAVSRHSMGRPGAPGAYDVVVDGMSPAEAAERLRRAGAPFARYQPKGSHGTQGPHLHLEPYGHAARSYTRANLWTVSAGSVVAEGDGKAWVMALPPARPRTLASFQREEALPQDDADAAVSAMPSDDEVTAVLQAGRSD